MVAVEGVWALCAVLGLIGYCALILTGIVVVTSKAWRAFRQWRYDYRRRQIKWSKHEGLRFRLGRRLMSPYWDRRWHHHTEAYKRLSAELNESVTSDEVDDFFGPEWHAKDLERRRQFLEAQMMELQEWALLRLPASEYKRDYVDELDLD